MKTTRALLIVMMLAAVGCAWLGINMDTPEARLKLATASYTAAVNTAVDLYDAGNISDQDLLVFGGAAMTARRMLDLWYNALTLDNDYTTYEQQALAALIRMQDAIGMYTHE